MKYFLNVIILGVMLCASITPYRVEGATEYTLLAPIPLNGAGSGDSPTANASTYIKGLFILTIAIATGLAVLALIFGGIKYMSTDAFSGKSEAKTTIEHAIWGLLLAISAWLILNTINPNLTKFDFSIPVQSIPANTNIPGPQGETTGCPTCLSLTASNIPTKPGIGTTVAGSLLPRLVELNARLGGTGWQVTEAYPPTTTHLNPCHTTGTCIDANVTSPTPAKINAFAAAARQSGLNPVYEVKDQGAKDTLIANGVTTRIDVEPTITAPHFSVYPQ